VSTAEPPDRHDPSGSPVERPPAAAGGEEAAAETPGARFARKAHRVRLYFYAGAAVVLLVFLIALVLANTKHVRVSWVFGTSSVSLVWLVLSAAILGLLLGMALGALFHWRTRRPRQASRD
jgi:uncharacterized integral membrane protein